MPSVNRFYRLRIRNAADSSDALVLTSVTGGTNPYIALPPSGDGEEINVVSGEVRQGSFSVLGIDHETSPGVFVITASLADVTTFDWQPLGRKAYLETSANGSSWTVQTAGYVQSVRFPTAKTAEFSISDAQRIDTTRRVFGEVSAAFSGATALIGGPVVGGTGPFPDDGPWRMEVDVATAGPPGSIELSFVRGTIRWDPQFEGDPGVATEATGLTGQAVAYIERRAEPFLQLNGFSVPTFPGLIAKLVPVGGGTTTFHAPWSNSLFDPRLLHSLTGRLGLFWDTAVHGTLPSVGADFNVYVYPTKITPQNPLHVQGHPIDILSDLWSEAGIALDATSEAAVKAALGDAWLDLRFTDGVILGDFTKIIFGVYGVGFRGGIDGERELFTTRKRSNASPAVSVAYADLLGRAEDQPVLFDLDEQSIVDRVTVTEKRFVKWTTEYEDERPPDDVLSFNATVSVDLLGVEPAHEVSFEIPGTTSTSVSGDFLGVVNTGSFDAFVQGIARDLLARFGRGCPTVEIRVVDSVAALLGDEIVLTAPHQINNFARGGSRVLQIVRRTVSAEGGIELKCLDAGANAQVATAPTITIAAVGKSAATVTVTNAGSMLAGSKVRIEWGSGGSAPAEGALLTLLDPTTETAITTPQVDSGTRVWARARSEHPDRRPSAWSSWSDVNLTDLTAPSALTNTGNVLSWTNGESARKIEILWRLSSESSPADRRAALLDAGATSFDMTGIVPASTSVEINILHRDDPPFNGVSAVDAHTYTTPATSTLATPVSPVGFVGGDGFVKGGTYGMEVTAVDLPSFIEFDEAVETGVGAGTYGSFVTVEMLAAVVGGPTRLTRVAPQDGLRRRMRARAVLEGKTPSSYTANVDVLPWGLPRGAPTARRNLPLTNDTGTTTDYAAKADNAAGTTISADVVQTDGVSLRVIAKGHLEGTARHGDAIVFPTNFQSVPHVRIWGGQNDEPRNKWGATGSGSETGAPTSNPQHEDTAALNLTVAGFTVRARLRQKGTTTARSHNFAANTLDTDGESIALTLSNAPSNNDQYTAHYSVRLEGTAGPTDYFTLNIVVAVDSNDGSGWVQRTTRPYSITCPTGTNVGQTWAHEAKVVVVSALDSTDQLRVRVVEITTEGDGSIDDAFVHAFDGTGDPASGVTYFTATDQYASKTPDSDDVVYWSAIEVS